jgi:MFS family permease
MAGAPLIIGLLTLIASREGNADKKQERESKATGPIPLGLFIMMGLIVLFRRTGESAPNVFFNVYLETGLYASTALIGSLVAICRLIAGLAALLMPLFVARWGKERVIGGGIFGVALSILPLALIPHWGAAGIGFIGAMALSAIVNVAYFVYGQEISSPGWQAVMSGVISMGGGVGVSLILIFGSRIISTYGYGSFFLTAAILTAWGGLLFLGYFRKPRGELARRSIPVTAD